MTHDLRLIHRDQNKSGTIHFAIALRRRTNPVGSATLEDDMQQEQFPTRPGEQHRLMERMASARISDEQARAILTSREEHRAFIAGLCSGMSYAAGKRP